MSEHPIMALLLDHSSFLGAAEAVEDEIMPLDAQLNLSPGDHALVASANTMLERDFTVVTLLDPEEHEGTFPDWNERVLKSYVLCRYFSKLDTSEHVGWFSRLKLLPITSEDFEQAQELQQLTEWPEELPDWARRVYYGYTEELAKRAPDRVPRQVVCPNCEQREVELKVVHRIEYTVDAGAIVVDEKDYYVPINDLESRDTHSARLQCTNCGSVATLEDNEWRLPGITN